MTFLSDGELIQLIDGRDSIAVDCRTKNAPATGTAPNSDWDDRIKAASLDLTIGDIFIPGKSAGKLGGFDKPRGLFSLRQGETAIVKTTENLKLTDSIGGIAFPPASLSLTGLLTTNPGHIDPGYEGPLHLTLINMGRDPILLQRGERIVRVLFYRMAQPSQRPFKSLGKTPVTEELLDGLSHDFLNIEERAKSAASSAVTRSQFFQSYGVPLIAAILAALGTYVSSVFVNNKSDEKITALTSRFDKLEGRIGGLSPVDKLDSQSLRDVIQDSFCGGYLGAVADGGCRVGIL